MISPLSNYARLPDRRGRRSLHSHRMYIRHRVALIKSLPLADRRGLGIPQKRKRFRGPLGPYILIVTQKNNMLFYIYRNNDTL